MASERPRASEAAAGDAFKTLHADQERFQRNEYTWKSGLLCDPGKLWLISETIWEGTTRGMDAPFDYRQAAVARCATRSGMSRVPDGASSATLSAKQEQNAATPAGGASLPAAILARQVSFAPADTDARDG
jgi:hypothetical protein